MGRRLGIGLMWREECCRDGKEAHGDVVIVDKGAFRFKYIL